MDGSAEYKAAYEKNNKAIRAFTKAQKAYRAREIGDAEFLAARKVYDAATAEFDAAYAKEKSWMQAGQDNVLDEQIADKLIWGDDDSNS